MPTEQFYTKLFLYNTVVLTGKGKTLLKVSNGLIYDRIFQNPITPTFFQSETVLQQASATWSYGQVGAPVYPNTFANESPAGLPLGTRSVYLTPPNMKVPRSYQALVALDQAFGDNFAVTVTGVFNNSWHKEILYDTNEVWNGAVFFRPNPSFLHIYQYYYSGRAQYRGFVISGRYHARKFLLNTSATLARSYDQEDNFSTQINDPRNAGLDYAPSIDTPRFRYVANGIYNMNRRMAFSALFQAQTGIRYSAFGGSTVSFLNDQLFNDRVPGTTRNEFLMPATNSLDLRFAYTQPLHSERARVVGSVDVLNVFNRSNVETVNTTWGPNPSTPLATFGSALQYYNPRELQLGVRFEF